MHTEVAVSGADKLVSRSVLGFVAPISLMLAGWWGTYLAGGTDPAIAAMAIAGLVTGLALDATFLRRRLDTLFTLTDRGLLALAVFYSVGIYGLFMGFPVFNVAVGVLGGYVVARRAAAMDWTRERANRDARRVAITLTWLLAALCGATAYMALNEATIGSQLQGMLGLSFTITRPMVYAIIAVGGAGLLAFQYAATLLTARWVTNARL